MTDNVKPTGKILFGIDYLNVMRWMELEDRKEDANGFGEVVDTVIRFFLLQWDFSVEEIDEANQKFWEKVNTNTIDEKVGTVIDRVGTFIKDDKKAQEKFIMELCAVANMNREISDDENWLVKKFQDRFDMRPSELEQLDKKGIDWCIALNYLGDQFIKFSKRKNNE